MTRLRHYDNLKTARFVTFSTYQRIPYLKSHANCHAVIEALKMMREKDQVHILAYVLMPDHVHLILLPPPHFELGPAIGRIKSRSARIMSPPPGFNQVYRPDGTRGIWQHRGYDHNCRNRDAVLGKINYCHMNPVKQGLVDCPEMWAWSSYNWYEGRRDVPLEMDAVEL